MYPERAEDVEDYDGTYFIVYPWIEDPFRFDRNWDELMSVVNRIESIKDGDIYYSVHISQHNTDITMHTPDTFLFGKQIVCGESQASKILNAHKALADFAEWYFEQQATNKK